ncbi:MAG: glycerophosphodiester phosphodiesterase [Candidatus Binatia bacterium]
MVLGHRGASGTHPENTLVSFRVAVEAGADGFEFDVQLSRDGVPVVIHDDVLERTTDGTGCVADRDADYLGGLDAGSWRGDEFATARLPLLDEVLAEFSGRCVMNLELKPDSRRQELVRSVLESARRFQAFDSVVFSSFDFQSLRVLRAEAPRARIGVLCKPGEEPAALGFARECGACNLHPHVSVVNAELLRDCAEAGLGLWTWNANDKEEATRLFGLGVDAVFSDFPERVVGWRKTSAD